LPLYEYKCNKCGHRFEKIEKVNAPEIAKCPKCGAKAPRMASAPAIQFKGTGWYVSDYGGKTGQPPSGEKSESKSDSKSEGSSDSKPSDSKSSDSSSTPAKESSSKESSSSKETPSSKDSKDSRKKAK
jgi:putative FmdB family regulatory protein